MSYPEQPVLMPLRMTALDPSDYREYTNRWLKVREYILNGIYSTDVIYILYPIKADYLTRYMIEKTGPWMEEFLVAYNAVLEELDHCREIYCEV